MTGSPGTAPRPFGKIPLDGAPQTLGASKPVPGHFWAVILGSRAGWWPRDHSQLPPPLAAAPSVPPCPTLGTLPTVCASCGHRDNPARSACPPLPHPLNLCGCSRGQGQPGSVQGQGQPGTPWAGTPTLCQLRRWDGNGDGAEIRRWRWGRGWQGDVEEERTVAGHGMDWNGDGMRKTIKMEMRMGVGQGQDWGWSWG